MRCLIEFAFNLQCVVGATQILPTALWSLFFMKDIPWYEGRYAITEDGRVWSYPKRCIYMNRSTKGKYMALNKTSDYHRISLFNEWVRKTFIVHRLVAKAFIENPMNKAHVNHIDWNTNNNHVSNLEWCTPSENQLHKYHVLKVESHRKIRIWKFKGDILLNTYQSMTEASIKNNVGIWDISLCVKGIKRKTAWWFIWKKM